jgi:hypothetical protein
MILYIAEMMRANSMTPVHRRLAVSLVAGTALFDPLTSDRLVQEPMRNLMNPRPVLMDIARERGWTANDDAVSGWHLGMSDCFEGRIRAHSALLALSDNTNELDSRIWQAEVSVILPYLEEQRREVLSRFGGLLKLPFTTRFGDVITDAFDLEISQIASQIGSISAGVDSRTRRRLGRMASVRNKLAHLEPLRPEDLEILG